MTRRTSRNPGESKPLPWPSTRRIVWYSHGDICSSMSSCRVMNSRQSVAPGAAVGVPPRSRPHGRDRSHEPPRTSQLEPELRRLVHGLEQQLVADASAPRASSGAKAGRPCAGSARSPTRPPPGRIGSEKSSCVSVAKGLWSILPDSERPLLGRGEAAPPGGGAAGAPHAPRSRSTSSSVRSRCSARARRCDSPSRRTAWGRPSSTARRVPGRRRSPASSRDDGGGVRGALRRVATVAQSS